MRRCSNSSVGFVRNRNFCRFAFRALLAAHGAMPRRTTHALVNVACRTDAASTRCRLSAEQRTTSDTQTVRLPLPLPLRGTAPLSALSAVAGNTSAEAVRIEYHRVSCPHPHMLSHRRRRRNYWCTAHHCAPAADPAQMNVVTKYGQPAKRVHCSSAHCCACVSSCSQSLSFLHPTLASLPARH